MPLARRPSAFDVGVHCINHTHLSMEKRWKMMRWEGRTRKRSHAVCEEDSLGTEGSTVEKESQEEHLNADRRKY